MSNSESLLLLISACERSYIHRNNDSMGIPFLNQENPLGRPHQAIVSMSKIRRNRRIDKIRNFRSLEFALFRI